MALIGADPRCSVLGKPPRPHLELPKDLFQCSSRGRKQINFPRRFTAWSLAVTEEWRLLFKVSKTDVNPSCLFPSWGSAISVLLPKPSCSLGHFLSDLSCDCH